MTKQQLEIALQDRLSKKELISLANQIGADEELYFYLWKQVQKGSDRYSRMAVWLLEQCSLRYPFLITKIMDEIVAFLPQPNHNGIHRGLIKILAHAEHIDEEHQGILYSLSIDWMLDPQKHVAIKVFCMEIAYIIAREEVDLQEELRLVINDQIPYNSVAFAARAKKILKLMKH